MWLVYIIGAVITGRLSYNNTDEQDTLDGQLVCRLDGQLVCSLDGQLVFCRLDGQLVCRLDGQLVLSRLVGNLYSIG